MNNAKIISTLVKKEMLDVLRDKKSVIMMLVIPIIIYPLLFIGIMQVMMVISSSMEQQSYRIVVNAEDDHALIKRLQQGIKIDSEQAGRNKTEQVKNDSIGIDQVDTDQIDADFQIIDADSIKDYQIALQENEIDVYVTGNVQGNQIQYQIFYLSSSDNSSYAADLVMEEMERLKDEFSEQKVNAAGLDVGSILEPVTYEKEDIASSEQSLGSIMGSILPFMLVVGLLMGTMHPAMDTTAGEKERGTLETMLTLPVTNRQLIVGKFLTVAAIGMVSVLLNILSMGGIAFYIYQVMGMQSETNSFDAALFLPALTVSVLAIFAFSLFISAITMCVTSFAKSYKEANNYIMPLTLTVMLTGYIGFIPNIELTQTMALVPVANICLLIKNLLLFQIDYRVIAIVLISNISYAVLAILFLSKIYDSEAILFGDSKASFQIFEKRSNLKKGGVPTISDACLVIAVTIVLVLYAGSILQLKYGIGGVFGTQLILLAVPLFVVLYTKKDVRLTYGFWKTQKSSYLGSVVLSIGLFVFNLVLAYGLTVLLPESAGRVSDSFSEIMNGGVLINLLVIALAPSICEEMLFRGVIFHSLKNKYQEKVAMGITAVLFGIYHMSFVKLIPTGLLGFALCYVVYRTGSIFPAMLIHFINNTLSVLLSEYPNHLENIFPILYKEALTVSDIMIMAGIGLVLIGIGLLILRKTSVNRSI